MEVTLPENVKQKLIQNLSPPTERLTGVPVQAVLSLSTCLLPLTASTALAEATVFGNVTLILTLPGVLDIGVLVAPVALDDTRHLEDLEETILLNKFEEKTMTCLDIFT